MHRVALHLWGEHQSKPASRTLAGRCDFGDRRQGIAVGTVDHYPSSGIISNEMSAAGLAFEENVRHLLPSPHVVCGPIAGKVKIKVSSLLGSVRGYFSSSDFRVGEVFVAGSDSASSSTQNGVWFAQRCVARRAFRKCDRGRNAPRKGTEKMPLIKPRGPLFLWG